MVKNDFNSNRFFAGFALAISLVLLVGSLSYYMLGKQVGEQEWIKHTYKVLGEVADIERLMVNMETGRRGFRCTGDRQFLQPYYESQPKLAPAIQVFKTTVKDNAEQLANAEQLGDDVAAVDSLWKSINVNIIYRDDSEKKRVTLAEKKLMDNVRADIVRINALEGRLLATRNASESDSIRQAVIVLVSGILLILVVVGMLIRSILKEFRNRVKAERTLQDNFAQLELVNDQTQRNNWLLTGIRQINDSLVGHDNVNALLQACLARLADYMNLPAGAFYFYDPHDKQLHIKGRLSLPPGDYPSIKLGAGIIGQVASQKEIKIINHVPAEYWKISSALGAQLPDTLICMPLWLNDQLKGVLELACINKDSDRFTGLLEAVSNNISVAIHAAYAAERMIRLLQQVQEQKEELESQQEELRQTNEELTLQTDVLRASEEELRMQEEELRQINVEMEEKTEAVEAARNALAQKAAELEQSNRYKSEFLANMSHELRTPLNSVLILADLLKENKGGNLTEKQMGYARIIHKSGSDLLDLINDILDLSKIEAGKLDMLFEEVPVADIAHDLEQLFMAQAGNKKISYDVKVATDVPAKITTDRQRLEQVLKNLLSNAFKFTPESGRVSLNFDAQDEYLQVSVTDTGIGIAEDKQQLIFEAFRQADGATNRKFGGTGLGLSISTALMRHLGGAIRVVSQPGLGSTFSITVPFSGGHTHEPAPVIATDSEMPQFDEDKVRLQTVIGDDRDVMTNGAQAILIIEDDVQFANIVVDFARSHGYKTIVATSGDEGIHYARKYRPVAIILDLGLPVIDGRSVLKILKATDAVRNIPIHVISAEDRRGLQGVENYFRKPLNPGDLDRAFADIDAYVKDKYQNILVVSAAADSEQFYAPFTAGLRNDVRYDVASSVAQAAEIISGRQFDCVILDIGHDISAGIEAARLIKSTSPSVYLITCIDADLNSADELHMSKVSDRLIRRSGHAAGRLLDEVELFLHRIKRPASVVVPHDIQTDRDESLKGIKVLLADDDMRNVFALTSVLEENGAIVIPAANGKEALELLNGKRKVDIVLMDIMMPEMDGYEAIRSIRSDARYARLPIIALTAKAMTGDREKCLQAGASDYIAKPIENSKLLSLMRVWISG